jgi:nucleotidyltransferase substrate binding protein (TIGR01987 family)
MALPETRWIQRFDNFNKILNHLEKLVHSNETGEYSIPDSFALIKMFELTFEMAWKVMKDYLRLQGFEKMNGSKDTIKIAFSEGIINDGEVWLDMIEKRNLAVHTYDEDDAQLVWRKVVDTYLKEFQTLRQWFHDKYSSEVE